LIINLNNEDIQWDTKEKLALGDLLEDFVSNRFYKDEFIATITVNGVRMSEQDMATAKRKPLSEVSSLHITSNTFRRVSIDALESVGEYLDGLAAMIETGADKFRTSNETEANAYFLGCIDGLQTFIGIIDKVKNLNALDFSKLEFESGPISEKESLLLGTLNSIFDTQSKKDWVSLADLLEFELVPLLMDWKGILHVVLDALKAP
jgi:hypothetical protein